MKTNATNRPLALLLALTLLFLSAGAAVPTPVLAAQSVAPTTDEVVVSNNTGKSDTIYVTGLTSGDRVCIYNAATGGKLLASGSIYASRTDLTLSVAQLGASGGSIYLTVTGKGMTESTRSKIDFDAEIVSDPPSADSISATNNVGKVDKVYVGGLYGGETIRIWNAETGGKVVGSLTVSASKYEATVSVNQLGTDAGTAWMTLTNKGELESERIAFPFDGEPKSVSLEQDQVVISNNAGYNDTVSVVRLSLGDTVKLYDSDKGGNQLSTATVAYGKTDVTLSVTQLGKSSGKVYATLTESGKRESARIALTYGAEGGSDEPSASSATISNNSGASDVVTVTGLKAGDMIRVYDSESGGTLLGSGTVATGKTEATVTISQLGESSGSVWMSLTEKNLYESERTKVAYSSEKSTDSVESDSVTITNNPAGKSDTLYLTGLSATDVVKVYDSATGGSLLVSGTVATGKTELTLTVAQLGADGGYVYITWKKSGKLESSREKIAFDAETQTGDADSDNVTIVNNANKADTVEVRGLDEGDVVKIYDTTGKQIGTATTAAYADYVTVSISQLGKSGGKITITITGTGEAESAKVAFTFDAEPQSDSLSADDITVENKAGTNDVVTVVGLDSGDKVKVYDAATGGTLLVSGTVGTTDSGTATASGVTGCTASWTSDSTGYTMTLTVPQLGKTADTLYVSILASGMTESARIAVAYAAEETTAVIAADDVLILNKVSVADTITVSGLAEDAVVTAYDESKAGNELGSATSDVTDGEVTITVKQLGSAAGTVWLTVTEKNAAESARTGFSYDAEPVSTAPSASNVTVVNNAGTSDTVTISGLDGGDVITLYDAAKAGDKLGTGTADQYGTAVTITVTQLGSAGGTVYATITGTDTLESTRTAVTFAAEPATDAIAASQATITNNAGISDVVKVTGLNGGDVVTLYNAATAGKSLGTATVSEYASTASVTVSQLGSTGGTVWITRTASGKAESARTAVAFAAEATTSTSVIGGTVVTNNAGSADTIQVSGLAGGSTVNAYDAATDGELLATATTGTYETTATLSVSQLGTSSGTIWLTVKAKGKLESSRIAVAYSAEAQSTAPSESNITVTNNANLSDTIEVVWLDTGDIVSVYDAATGGSLLGTATVSGSDTEATVKVSQLGASAGTVYVTITGTKCLESARTAVAYSAEETTVAPDAGNIVVTNNAGIKDTVEVYWLDEGDLVKVYASATGTTALGTATVAAGDDTVEIEISQLGEDNGVVYVSVTASGEKESDRVKMTYEAEQESSALSASNVLVYNYAGLSDVIEALYLSENDKVKVYSAATNGTLLGSATVAADETGVDVTVSQLGTGSGTVYVSVIEYGKTESDRVAISYLAEQNSDAPDAADVTATVYSDKSDKIAVTGLMEYDLVKIYKMSSSGSYSLITSGTVDADETEITISIELGTSVGTVYVSVTSYGCYESDKTGVKTTAGD